MYNNQRKTPVIRCHHSIFGFKGKQNSGKTDHIL